MFNSGTDFGKARTFDVGTQFDSTMTFYENRFLVINQVDKQVFADMTFGMNHMFGAGSDFTAQAHS